ncbi:MAG TPA: 2-phosphosulfolactate phosphatase [Candidatus Thermoplasmatota archaeon]|nr:2-phosphosulfolactate phosphatase [Candidatus Thermoplasmatota archaeon]
MNIQILPGLKGAKKAKGITVIIDVFRASTTILAVLQQGAKNIIPVKSLEQALLFKKQDSTCILVGERNGKKISKFDYGNSPATMISLNLNKKSIVLSTSSGTKGICDAIYSSETIIAGFANISKVISYINNKNTDQLSIVPMGLNATTPAIEDDLCAQLIKKRLQHESVHYKEHIKPIMNSPGIKRLRNLKQQKDIFYCLTQDILPIIAVYDKNRKNITPI